MCGIFLYASEGPERIVRGERGLGALRHRGPDSAGSYVSDDVYLGHARLKILDLSDGANQPMGSTECGLWVAFNGEIYNFRELRQFLKGRGYRFETTGDTEVLLYLYQELGRECLDKLNGMFSFVIWDERNRTIFCARDRLGIKPLYYSWNGRRLIVSSEVRAITTSIPGRWAIDSIALEDYLVCGSVLAPNTIFDEIKSLLPGHLMVLEDRKLSIEKWWNLPFVPEQEKVGREAKQIREDVREILESSIDYRLLSDVPVGVFLSGGIDSTAVLSLANRRRDGIDTFSLGFNIGGDRFNETSIAQMTANAIGSRHHETILTNDDVFGSLGKFMKHIDQPSTDGLNTYLVSKIAREKVTVALSGLGGDEVFSGYGWTRRFYRLLRLRRNLPLLPENLNNGIRQLLWRGVPDLFDRKSVQIGIGALFGWPDLAELYLTLRGVNTRETARKVLNLERMSRRDGVNLNGLSPLDKAGYFDFSIYLRNTLLRDCDAASMAHSLEVRVPLLDHRLVEYVARLPEKDRLRQGGHKSILTGCIEDILPKHVLGSRKRGFCFPLSIWMGKQPMRDTVMDCLSENGLRGRAFFDQKYLGSLIDDALSAGCFEPYSAKSYRLWQLTVLELWFREHFDSNNAQESAIKCA